MTPTRRMSLPLLLAVLLAVLLPVRAALAASMMLAAVSPVSVDVHAQHAGHGGAAMAAVEAAPDHDAHAAAVEEPCVEDMQETPPSAGVDAEDADAASSPIGHHHHHCPDCGALCASSPVPSHGATLADTRQARTARYAPLVVPAASAQTRGDERPPRSC